MIRLGPRRTPQDLLPRIERLFDLSAAKIRAIEETWRPEDGAPVFTVEGRYRARGCGRHRATRVPLLPVTWLP